MSEAGRDVRGLGVILERLETTLEFALDALEEGLTEGVQMLTGRVRENIGLEDHTLAELAALDHPYAQRHGSRGMEIHDPWYQVHRQSGMMKSAVISGVEKNVATDRVDGYTGVDTTIAPHARYVIEGTTKMIPRDVLTGSLEEMREEIQRAVIETVGLKFRAKARIKFTDIGGGKGG